MQIQTNTITSSQAVSALGDDMARLSGASIAGQAAKTTGNAQAVGGQNARLQQPPVSEEGVLQAIDQVNETIKSMGSNDLQFSVDKDTESVVVKVIDRQTHEVIRQIPSEEFLQIAKALDKLKGLLVQDKV